MEQYDFVAIGDTVVDTFIGLKDAEILPGLDHQNRELCVSFGDKVPYESLETIYAVGNSANASTSAARLGLHAALITTLGDDENGKKCFETLSHNGISTEFVATSSEYPTNHHFVLRFGADRTILIKHEPYPYNFPNFKIAPKWIYFSSVGPTSLPFHVAVSEYLKNNPETKLAFQPGTFQMDFGTQALADIYKRTEVFICNVEESQRILKLETRDLKILLKGIYDLGPKIVCITDGPAGAYMFDGTDAYFMPIYPDPAPPVSRTGCGDAFASTFVSALIMGKTPLEALLLAPINPMNVVQHVGAQTGLLTLAQLQDLYEKRPADYKYKKI
jgi:sugar/nucleoside kinase (ribokinase family)